MTFVGKTEQPKNNTCKNVPLLTTIKNQYPTLRPSTFASLGDLFLLLYSPPPSTASSPPIPQHLPTHLPLHSCLAAKSKSLALLLKGSRLLGRK